MLSVAGFDPSGGAGVVADIRAAEQRQVLCQGAITGNTVQDDRDFVAVHWLEAQCLAQVRQLAQRYPFAVVKVGLVPSLAFMEELLVELRGLLGRPQVVWDPILKASAGFQFHGGAAGELDAQDLARLERLLPQLALITPNVPEAQLLFPQWDGRLALVGLPCGVLLKGGHALVDDADALRVAEGHQLVTDVLMLPDGTAHRFTSPRLPGEGKHGSGCVLSSLVAAGLARGEALAEACQQAKRQMDHLQASSSTRLGVWA